MWQLAFKAMLGDRGKLLTALLGVAFAVVLVNMQGGLLLGFLRKTSLLIDHGQADIWVGHQQMNNVDMSTFIPERWIQRIRGLDAVERVDAYLVVGGEMRMRDGRFELAVILGCEPDSPLGQAWSESLGTDPRHLLREPDSILVDEHDAPRLGNCRVGDLLEINNRRARVAGLTRNIVGFTGAPYVFTTMERARHSFGSNVPPGCCSYFLVKLKPGAEAAAVCAQIRERLPQAGVYERSAWGRRTMLHWLAKTGIGLSFGLATLLGLLVGLAVVAQTLYATVTERIREFATLKALGADDRGVLRFLLCQALSSAGLGSALGLVAAQVAGWLVDSVEAPVVWTWWIGLASVLLITGVCLVAAWLPYGRIRSIDPACVLRT